MLRYALVLTAPALSSDDLAAAAALIARDAAPRSRPAATLLAPADAPDVAPDAAPDAARAAEWCFECDPAAIPALLEAGRQCFAARPIDVNIVPADADRRKRLLIADMDSTIIGQECIDEIAAFAGHGPEVAAITERAMRGELDFEAALATRVALLEGLDTATLERVITERLTLTPGARSLVATMAAHGAFSALVSGGFTFFTSRIAALAGFHTDRANTLEIADGRLTGRVVPPILGRAAKLRFLEEFATAQCIPMAATLAVGDGANDLAMIQAAGLGVAYHAKPVVAAEATARIEHSDLTALLYLQGYHRHEIIC